jgi:hypothetical protein
VFDPASDPGVVRLTLVVGLVLCALLFVRPTKVAGIGCLAALFVCAASLNARAPFAISSAEMYLAVLLFWVAIGSIIGWSGHMLRAFRIQIAVVYLSPLLIRFFHGGETWIDGSALRLVVDNPEGRRGPFGSLVRHLPDAVLSIATWGTLVVESLHACIALICGLWFFSAVAVIGLIAAVHLLEGDRSVPHTWFAPWLIAACVVGWSFLSVSDAPAVAAAQQRNVAPYVVRGAGITQVWGVFSPNPPRLERWVEIIDGSGNLLIDSRGESPRMRKLVQNVRSQPDGLLGRAWLSTLCSAGAVRLDIVTRRPDTRDDALSFDCTF